MLLRTLHIGCFIKVNIKYKMFVSCGLFIGVFRSSCRRSRVMPECQYWVSRVSASMQLELTRWSRCFATSRTPIQDFSLSLLCCLAKLPSTVNAAFITVNSRASVTVCAEV